MSAEQARLARIRWCLHEAATSINMPLTALTLTVLSKAMNTVMEEQGIWLMFKDNYETELAELIKDVGE